MGDLQIPPDHSPEMYIRTLLIGDLFLGCVFAVISLFSRTVAGLSCIAAGVTRIRQAISKESVSWEAGSPEMNHGRLIIVIIAIIWILVGIFTIASDPTPAAQR